MTRIFILFWCLFFGGLAQAHLSKMEVEKLVSDGEKQALECNETLAKIRSLDKNFDDNITFKNKKITWKAVSFLKTFKGTPVATQELMDKLITGNKRILDMKWLSSTMNKTLVCDPSDFNLVLTKILRSMRAFKFSLKEKQKVARLILTSLKHDAISPTHLGLLAPYILILDGLVDQGAVKLSPEGAVKREELRIVIQSGLEKLKGESNSKKTETKEDQTKNFLAQVRDNERVRIKFLEFLETL